MTHSAEKDAGLNLDLDFIDYPTGWAIQRMGLEHSDPRCSAEQTGGAMLCDCKALVYKWAELKWQHERVGGAERERKSVLREVERALRSIVVTEDSMASDEDEIRYSGQWEVAEQLREWLSDQYPDTNEIQETP